MRATGQACFFLPCSQVHRHKRTEHGGPVAPQDTLQIPGRTEHRGAAAPHDALQMPGRTEHRGAAAPHDALQMLGRTEHRGTAAPQDALQMPGTEAEAVNSALAGAVASDAVSVVYAQESRLGKTRASGRSLGGKKQFSSQSSGSEEKPMAHEDILQASDP